MNQNPTYPLDFFTADGSSMFDFFTGFTGAISHTATLTPIALVNATSVLGYKCFLCGTGSLSNKVRNPAESKPLCETRTPPLDFDAVRACFAGCCILSLVVAAFRVRAVCSSSLSTSLTDCAPSHRNQVATFVGETYYDPNDIDVDNDVFHTGSGAYRFDVDIPECPTKPYARYDHIRAGGSLGVCTGTGGARMQRQPEGHRQYGSSLWDSSTHGEAVKAATIRYWPRSVRYHRRLPNSSA